MSTSFQDHFMLRVNTFLSLKQYAYKTMLVKKKRVYAEAVFNSILSA